VDQYAFEQTEDSLLTIEVLTDSGPQTYAASIADLTGQELWVALDQWVGEALDPGRTVRLVLSHPDRPPQITDTIVLWHLGKTGKIVVLKRPGFWDPPSRREHLRVRLAVPVYLKADDGAGPVPTTSVNIGVGGLFCVAAMDLRIAQRLDVAIHLTPDQTFECQAEVARLDEDPNDPVGLNLMVGLQLLDIAPRDQARLSGILSDLARDVDANYVPRCWQPDADPLQVLIGVDSGYDDEDDGEAGESLVSLDLEERSA
jgi:hypothetical protein